MHDLYSALFDSMPLCPMTAFGNKDKFRDINFSSNLLNVNFYLISNF